jgi:hypothetical protein
MSRSTTLRKRRADLEAFAEALHRFLGVMEPQRNGLLYDSGTTWVPQAGREAEAARLKMEVDRLAGPAAYAFAAAGSYVDWKPRGTMQWQPVNPATAWATILERDPRFDAETIISCCSQALGLLEMKAEEAEEHERRRVRRFFAGIGRLTGSQLRPLAKWAARGASTLVIAGVTVWLGWV